MSAPPKYTDDPVPAPSSPSGSASKAPTKSYGAVPSAQSSAPLLSSPPPSSSRNAWMNQPSDDDLPDDFKVGVTVIDCDPEIRLAFIRKVYSILFIQLLCTAVVGVGMSTNAAITYTHENPWIVWVPMIGSFVSLLGTYWKRHDFPLNMVMLGLFTLFEAVMVGAVTSYYESKIVSIDCGSGFADEI